VAVVGTSRVAEADRVASAFFPVLLLEQGRATSWAEACHDTEIEAVVVGDDYRQAATSLVDDLRWRLRKALLSRRRGGVMIKIIAWRLNGTDRDLRAPTGPADMEGRAAGALAEAEIDTDQKVRHSADTCTTKASTRAGPPRRTSYLE
jgi:hypothetical protein